MTIDRKSLDSKLASLPRGAANLLGGIMSSSNFKGVISAADAAKLALQLGITTQQLSLKLVPFAQLYAVVPVSNFHVGAVGMGLSGALYYGANLEVSGQALSFTVHAEQSATSNAWVNGEQGLSALGVSAAPCGYCRQFLYELVTAATLTVLLPGTSPTLLTTFLPDAFGPGDLGVKGGLMQAQNNGLQVSSQLDPAGMAALAAANASYSPYTSTFAGVALALSDGTIVAGRYAENAAYNPSMSPLEAALSLAMLSNHSYGDITEAVLVEARGTASQVGATQTVLGSVTSVPLTTITATTA
jgi:cytidine deaminase